MKRGVLRYLNFQSLTTSTLLLYYVFKGVSWPPHYDDEPWIWSEAINYLRGDRDHKTILGSEVDTNPIFSLISKLILMVSPLDFWQSMRLSSLLLATLFCVFSLLSLEKLSGIRFRYTFLLLFFLNPLFDVLLYGRLEAFALAFAWSSILALLYRRLTLSALLFSLALSIHPLVVALIPMHLMAFRSTWEKFNTKVFSFSLSLLVFMIMFNASLLTNFSNYITLLRWTGTSSTVFSDQSIVSSVFQVSLDRLLRIAIVSPPFILGIIFVFMLSILLGKRLHNLKSSYIEVAPLKLKKFALPFTLSAVLFTLLVSRSELSYLVFMLPQITLIAVFLAHKSLRSKTLIGLFFSLTLCGKLLAIELVPEVFTQFTPVQYAMSVDVPDKYMEAIDSSVPERALVLAPPVVLPSFIERSDIVFRGIYWISQPNAGKSTIPPCRELRVKLRAEANERPVVLILFHTWTLRQFQQYDSRYTQSEFSCLIAGSKMHLVRGQNDDGTPWSWHIYELNVRTPQTD